MLFARFKPPILTLKFLAKFVKKELQLFSTLSKIFKYINTSNNSGQNSLIFSIAPVGISLRRRNPEEAL